MSGTLFIVSTPIGNLDDISARARQVLADVDVIAAEDTRNAARLLDHYGLRKPLVSYHDHNEQERTRQLLARLQQGETVALVSDAGTPLVSDPGYRLVQGCHRAGVTVVPVPGASALLAALVAAGLPTDRFVFEGFLPAKGAARGDRIAAVMGRDATVVLYEAPRRIADLLARIAEREPGRELVLCRELTKQFETILSGTAEHVLSRVLADDNQQRGEMVLVLSPAPAREADEAAVLALGKALLAELPASRAARVLAAWSGLKRQHIYQLLEELRSEDGAGEG